MILNQLNPFIRYGGCHKYYNDVEGQSICYDCRLFFVSSGEGVLLIDGYEHQISANTVIYLPPFSKYRFKFKNNRSISIYVINFDLTNENSYLSRSLGTATESNFDSTKIKSFPMHNVFENPIILYNIFELYSSVSKCVEIFQLKDEYFSQKSSAILKLMLVDILQTSKNENVEYKLAQQVVEYIRIHYEEVDLTNEVIAVKFNYHPYHLNRIFKAYTGKPIHNYLLEYRIQKAKNYLRTTILSVTVIAEKVGFSSYTYFIKLFRERTGVSPLKYRKLHSDSAI